jgi:23S rRNA pseudouridine1911/1915/1917 synthase
LSALTPSPSESFAFTAAPDQAGQRVDRVVAEAIGSLSRSRVKALIEQGLLTRGERPVRDPSEPVKAGLTYTLQLPPPEPATPQAQDIPLDILFEDDDLLVLNKPAGLVVHPAPGNADGTLVNALLAHAGEEFSGIGGEMRPGIVHRLDKDTSGIMVVAKSDRAHRALSETFANRDLDRSYLALVWGVPRPAAGEIEGAIGRHPTDRKRMAVVARGGKPALTHYATLAVRDAGCALIRCKLATGRTHQIRVHLATKGHPLVGDPVYLRKIPGEARNIAAPIRDQLLAFPRQALHAASLGFRHPVSGQALAFSAPPPADMAALLAVLGFPAEAM